MVDEAKHTTGETTQAIRYTVPPRNDTKVVFNTLPGATCTLGLEDNTDSNSNSSIKLYADQEGAVRFYVRPEMESEDLIKLAVDCEVAGNVRRHPLELRVSSKPTPEMPAPPRESPKPLQQDASFGPALSEEDMLHLSDEELLKMNYPPRPNPDKAPQAFKSWQRSVSVPMTFVKPQTVSRQDISHGFAKIVSGATVTPMATTTAYTSPNWSGFELRGAGPYVWVNGDWIVPRLIRGGQGYLLFWVGLDGDSTTDLVQAVTGAEIHDINKGGRPVWMSSYFAWTEFLPQQPFFQQITNFPIQPGDEVVVEVYIADAGKPPDLAGYFGQFWINNLTTGQSTIVSTPRGSTTVSGSGAEWIMERPSGSGGGYYFLPNYGSATMQGAYASTPTGGNVDYQGDNNRQFTMVNGSNTLSTVAPSDGTSMVFQWVNYA